MKSASNISDIHCSLKIINLLPVDLSPLSRDDLPALSGTQPKPLLRPQLPVLGLLEITIPIPSMVVCMRENFIRVFVGRLHGKHSTCDTRTGHLCRIDRALVLNIIYRSLSTANALLMRGGCIAKITVT